MDVQCTKCEQKKDASNFPSGRKKNGLGSWCTGCISAQKVARRLQDSEYRIRDNARQTKFRKANLELCQLRHLTSLAKARGHAAPQLTVEDLKTLRQNHSGVCDFGSCTREADHIDHDHDTGAFRGFLCRQHNMALGLFNDSITALTDAIEYLQRTV
jgi:hypothetical protein